MGSNPTTSSKKGCNGSSVVSFFSVCHRLNPRCPLAGSSFCALIASPKLNIGAKQGSKSHHQLQKRAKRIFPFCSFLFKPQAWHSIRRIATVWNYVADVYGISRISVYFRRLDSIQHCVLISYATLSQFHSRLWRDFSNPRCPLAAFFLSGYVLKKSTTHIIPR